MTDDIEHFWDSLTAEEGAYAKQISHVLSNETWAHQLLADIADNGGITCTNKAKLFELRFGYELQQTGITPSYEVEGEAESSIDFGFECGGQKWLVELMRLEDTGAVRRATQTSTDENGVQWSERTLSTDAEDQTQSEEGETLKAVQRICQKCERDGRPHKFPIPNNAYHVMLVDFRTFLHGGDDYDRLHVGLGGKSVPVPYQRAWDGRLISGVFDLETNVRGAVEIRERVHFIGFVDEQSYQAGEFALVTRFIANPNLFAAVEEIHEAIDKWPLQPAAVLNAPR